MTETKIQQLVIDIKNLQKNYMIRRKEACGNLNGTDFVVQVKYELTHERLCMLHGVFNKHHETIESLIGVIIPKQEICDVHNYDEMMVLLDFCLLRVACMQ